MLVSHKWLKEFVDFDYSPQELDEILTMLGIEVEGIVNYKEKYANFYIGKVLESEKHPNADKLSVCKVDYGEDVKTVVCGAPNVAEGQKIVFAAIGAKIPSAGFTIEKRAVRKIESEGMICSQAELELGDDASGIWVLPETATTGMPLAEYLGLDDIIYEIGITPNRADCLSHLGIAREIAAYQRKQVEKPSDSLAEGTGKTSDSITVEIEDIEKCPRYTARVIRNVKVQESPMWLKQRLILCGMRPVNAVVDVTNYILLECGQPLHAFDLAKIKGNKIICKTAKDGEKFITLDDKEQTLDSSMLMICDAERSLAIGGVMGGQNSEISDETTDILLESAYFNPTSIRKTAKKLGMQTESSYRFERGVDFENIVYASNRAAKLIAELTGGTIEEGIIDVYPEPIAKNKVTLRYKRAADIIGADVAPEAIKDMLTALDFEIIEENENSITVEVPGYRVDIALEIDLIEEVARMFNYDNIEPDFTVTIDSSGTETVKELRVPALRKPLREYLVAKGFHESLTQNQTDPKTTAIFTDKPVEIANPLGEELSIMRPSLFPAMLRTVERNHRLGNFDLRLFEIGKTFHRAGENDKTFVKGVIERENLIIAISGNAYPPHWSDKSREVDFYDIRGIAEDLLRDMKIKRFKFIPLVGEHPVFSPNAVEIYSVKQAIGYLGEVSAKILKQFDIEHKVFAVEINLNNLYEAELRQWRYEKVSPFPKVIRDLAFVVDADLPAEEIRLEIMKNAGKLAKSVEIFDVYKGKNIEAGKKSIAFTISYSAPDRTLTDKEVDESINYIISHIEKKFGAKLRKS
jgi:phenylalanyl-tRNA synthetase beta chain